MTQLPNYTSSTLPFKSLVLEHEFWSNPRSQTALDASDIAELADDMAQRRKDGKPPIQVPLMVVQAKKADSDDIINVVLDGQRRVLAGREGAVKPGDEVPIQFMTDKPIVLTWEKSDELLLDVLGLTVRRAGLSSYELSEVAERMRNRDKPLAEIGKAIAKSESWVSKFLSARKNAHAVTLKQWRAGKLTDEQFKEVAQIPHDEQPAALGEAAEAGKAVEQVASKREVKAEVRAKIKEAATKAKEAKAAKVEAKPGKALAINGTKVAAPTGKQRDMFDTSDVKADKAAPVRPEVKPTSKAELEAAMDLIGARPPTDAYVKGVADGIRYALGLLTPDLFARPWKVWVTRASGKAPSRPVKAKKPRAKKPAKKGKGKR